MDKGMIHVYTGDGKGKSTSAFGLSIRAAGAGKKVYIVQFLKSSKTSELCIIEKLKPQIQIFRFEKPRDFVWNLDEKEKKELKKEVREAFEFASLTIREGHCDLMVLDEIMGAITNKFIEVDEIIKCLLAKNQSIEVVLTGRNVPEEIVNIADYVSEIKCIKHPYQRGVSARLGIEF
jgi:cob(I)alamin adenosyltransferase